VQGLIETPLEDQFLIGCELLLMMEGYLFFAVIFMGKNEKAILYEQQHTPGHSVISSRYIS